MDDWHPQDWLLIKSALVDHAGAATDSPRDRRCWELAEEIVVVQGLSLAEAVQQTDPNWRGPP
jgi:hypothetical protein